MLSNRLQISICLWQVTKEPSFEKAQMEPATQIYYGAESWQESEIKEKCW